MTNNKKKAIQTLLCLIFLIVFAYTSYAQTPQETLNQYIADLQKNPNDNVLREKIIKHVQTMRPAPAIPEQAREYFVMAATFVEKAKDNAGYERAIEKYKAALLQAPWWADPYKKLAIVQKTAAQYDDAIGSLRLYILTQPSDARDAQDEIYKLKALKQTDTEEVKTESPAENSKSDLDVSGRWIWMNDPWGCMAVMHIEFQLNGDTLIEERVLDSNTGPEICGFRGSQYKGQRKSDVVYHRTGKNRFESEEDMATQQHTIEFIGEKAFTTYEQRSSGTKRQGIMIRK